MDDEWSNLYVGRSWKGVSEGIQCEYEADEWP